MRDHKQGGWREGDSEERYNLELSVVSWSGFSNRGVGKFGIRRNVVTSLLV